MSPMSDATYVRPYSGVPAAGGVVSSVQAINASERLSSPTFCGRNRDPFATMGPHPGYQGSGR